MALGDHDANFRYSRCAQMCRDFFLCLFCIYFHYFSRIHQKWKDWVVSKISNSTDPVPIDVKADTFLVSFLDIGFNYFVRTFLLSLPPNFSWNNSTRCFCSHTWTLNGGLVNSFSIQLQRKSDSFILHFICRAYFKSFCSLWSIDVEKKSN